MDFYGTFIALFSIVLIAIIWWKTFRTLSWGFRSILWHCAHTVWTTLFTRTNCCRPQGYLYNQEHQPSDHPCQTEQQPSFYSNSITVQAPQKQLTAVRTWGWQWHRDLMEHTRRAGRFHAKTWGSCQGGDITWWGHAPKYNTWKQ